MKVPAKKYLGVVLLMAVVLISSHIAAEELTSTSGDPVAQTGSSMTVPDLSEIIPLAA